MASFSEEEIALLATKNRLFVSAFWPRRIYRVFESFCGIIANNSSSSPFSSASKGRSPLKKVSNIASSASSSFPGFISPAPKVGGAHEKQTLTQAQVRSNLELFRTLYFSSLPSFKSPANAIRGNNTHTQNYVEGDPYTITLSYVDFAKALRKTNTSWREFYFDELVGIALLVDTSRQGFISYQDFSNFCLDFQSRVRKSTLNPKETIKHCFDNYVTNTLSSDDNEDSGFDFEIERELIRKLSGMAYIAQKFGISPLLKYSEIKSSSESLTPLKVIELLQMVGHCEVPYRFFNPDDYYSEHDDNDDRCGDNQSTFDDNSSNQGSYDVEKVVTTTTDASNSHSKSKYMNTQEAVPKLSSNGSNLNGKLTPDALGVAATTSEPETAALAEKNPKNDNDGSTNSINGINNDNNDYANDNNKGAQGAQVTSAAPGKKKKNKNKNKNSNDSTSSIIALASNSASSTNSSNEEEEEVVAIPATAETRSTNKTSASPKAASPIKSSTSPMNSSGSSAAMAFPSIESSLTNNAVEATASNMSNNNNNSNSSSNYNKDKGISPNVGARGTSLIFNDQDDTNNQHNPGDDNIMLLPTNLSFSKKDSPSKSRLSASPRTPYHKYVEKEVDLSIFRSPRYKVRKQNERLPPKFSTEGDLRESVCHVRYRPAMLTGKYNNRFQTTQDLMVARRVNQVFFDSEF